MLHEPENNSQLFYMCAIFILPSMIKKGYNLIFFIQIHKGLKYSSQMHKIVLYNKQIHEFSSLCLHVLVLV